MKYNLAVSKRLSDRCDIGEFDCALGDTCIPLSKFRDGHIDCLDGSDECKLHTNLCHLYQFTH